MKLSNVTVQMTCSEDRGSTADGARPGRGPHGVLTVAGIQKILSQARVARTVSTITFGGDDPFLHFPVLAKGLWLAQLLEFRTAVITSCWWATSEQDAELWLRPLVEAGLDELILREDGSREGPVECVVQVARNLGLPESGIHISRPLARGGFRSCPREDLEDPETVFVDAFGNVQVCPGVRIGNLADAPLYELVAGYEAGRHPIRGPLVRGGPRALAREHGIALEGRFDDGCHYCFEVRRRLVDRLAGVLAPRLMYGLEDRGTDRVPATLPDRSHEVTESEEEVRDGERRAAQEDRAVRTGLPHMRRGPGWSDTRARQGAATAP